MEDGNAPPAGLNQEERQWSMFLHLSLLLNFIAPLAGIVAPIVIWQIKKEQLPGIDAHGKAATNWIISSVIYAAVFALLSLVLIGVPLLIALGVLWVVFPIIAGVKANNGELWNYPLSIAFLK